MAFCLLVLCWEEGSPPEIQKGSGSGLSVRLCVFECVDLHVVEEVCFGKLSPCYPKG